MYRSGNSKNVIFGGICAGISKKFKISLIIVRIFFISIILLEPFMLFIYFLLWLILPINPLTLQEIQEENLILIEKEKK